MSFVTSHPCSCESFAAAAFNRLEKLANRQARLPPESLGKAHPWSTSQSNNNAIPDSPCSTGTSRKNLWSLNQSASPAFASRRQARMAGVRSPDPTSPRRHASMSNPTRGARL